MQMTHMIRSLSRLAGSAIALAAAVAHAAPVTPRFEHAISNLPGKTLVSVEVSFVPGEVSRPHHHAPSAFIYVYVLSGTIRSQLEGEPAHDYHAGDSWYEAPGAHHVQARNLSASQPAKLLAVFLIDTDDKTLTTPDHQDGDR
jgi:quercetin dioxygenase-like cupin family protein